LSAPRAEVDSAFSDARARSIRRLDCEEAPMPRRAAPRRRASRVGALAAALVPVALVGAVAAARSPAPVAAFDPAAARDAYRRPTSIPFPEANPHTPARETLGRTLFFDPRLSWVTA
jgi:hypothetical protein